MKTLIAAMLVFIFMPVFASQDSCVNIGGAYHSQDNQISAQLQLGANDAISGVFTVDNNGQSQSATLFSSGCYKGLVFLQWIAPDFGGVAEGVMDAGSDDIPLTIMLLKNNKIDKQFTDTLQLKPK